MTALSADIGAQLQVLASVVVAMLLGGAIGFEREAASRPAGLRTHMLVAAASALLVSVGNMLIVHFSSQGYGGAVLRIDPMRLVEAVVTAVGFLGAGTIFRHGSKDVVIGLTTAASLLMVAVVGIVVGLQQYVVATGATVLALLVLWLLRRLEHPARKHDCEG